MISQARNSFIPNLGPKAFSQTWTRPTSKDSNSFPSFLFLQPDCLQPLFPTASQFTILHAFIDCVAGAIIALGNDTENLEVAAEALA